MNCHEDGSLDCGGSYGLGKKVHVSITVQTIYVLGYGEAEEKKWRLHLSTVSEVVKAGTGGENCVTSQDYSHHTSGGTAAFCNSPDCGLAWTGLCWTQCSWHRKGRSSLLLKRHLFYARHWASSLTCIISLTFHNETIFTYVLQTTKPRLQRVTWFVWGIQLWEPQDLNSGKSVSSKAIS